MEIPLSYELLRVIWWALLGVLLIGFAITDGFDLGVAGLLPFVARTDAERRLAINTVGPTWEGNQVWLILGGGAIFAAWPLVYAVSFSSFYLAMFVVLASLILRPVAFKYRSKREDPRWRSFWDWALFTGGFVPALIFGVAVGNVLVGAPFRMNDDMRIFWDGSFFGLLNPFSLLCGLLSVTMLFLHGAAWLSMKTEYGIVRDRARAYAPLFAFASIVLFALAGAWVAFGDIGYQVTNTVAADGPSNPRLTETVREGGAWLSNYGRYPWMLIAPVLGFGGAALALFGLRSNSEALTFVGSKLSVVGIISTVGVSMFPFILPSSVDPNASLTVWNASSSHTTLFVMLIVTAVLLPIVLLYTAWAFKVMWGRVTTEAVANGDYY
ncbi:cytochrome d ubiquinol oxidase subunit II [Oceanicaulis sp. UBA2681]|uniref:cytochrome d ubiquinol oxidase subunit II n=1 Tax=Oceanicaulis sp. UBA2681 TaxID=1947007 RepID=UPI000EE94B1A|nr:cytochrome d ubiquinol oxidase subunit II [Oceanicaulis sp. UBA2681]HCR67344.1 cytochrome d ubiquinol oxidase subunit II [Oceanicaulis sp.]|tara:strand:+ start:6490 stop:7635 length:1146 start_codon:yes stop_codon:yes gene_type:complete